MTQKEAAEILLKYFPGIPNAEVRYAAAMGAEALKNSDCSVCNRRSWYQKGYQDGLNADKWIPCEKDMPPKPKENPVFENKPLEMYMVTVKNTDYPFRAFWNGKFFTDGFSRLNVTAWQQLPEPYKEGEK